MEKFRDSFSFTSVFLNPKTVRVYRRMWKENKLRNPLAC